jgi:hypothetical protein
MIKQTHKALAAPRSHAAQVVIALLGAWLVVSAYGIWKYASKETEPPVFDALSYVQKAQAFWAAVAAGHLFNPLNLEPPIRPFGTVFFTHPYGFTTDFRPFYFLSEYLPSLILALAVFLAAGVPAWRHPRSAWVVGILAIVAASLPSYYQFASAEGVPIMGTWGFVDTLFGALGAIAIAFATRAVPTHWMRDTVVSALIAVFAIFVKPAGLSLMLLVGGAWGLMALAAVIRGRLALREFFKGLAVYVALYAITALILYHSEYFSRDNYLYGLSSMRLLHEAQVTTPTFAEIANKFHLAFGLPLVILMFAGIGSAMWERNWERLGVAFVCLAGGFWLWLGQTNIEHVRYFFPFPVMAVTAVVPSLAWAAAKARPFLAVLCTVLLLPTILIGALLLSSQPSAGLQRLSGINLSTDLHAGEVAQGRALSNLLAKEPARISIIYYCGVAPKVKAFEAVMDWNRVLGLKGGNSNPALPIDWVREHAYRLDEMVAARFLVFEPYANPLQASASIPVADTFDREQVVVRAWLSTLGEADGVRTVSDDGVRVLEILDPLKVVAAASRDLLPKHAFRSVFLQGFSMRAVLTPAQAKNVARNSLPTPVELGLGTEPLISIDAIVRTPQADHTERFDVYIHQAHALPTVASGWTVFIHAKDDSGELVQGYASYKDRIVSSAGDVVYHIVLPPAPRAATHYAVGVFRHATSEEDAYLTSENGDWDGRRHVF